MLAPPGAIPPSQVLSFSAGDLIDAYEPVEFGWWRGRRLPLGPVGYFDLINVEVVDPSSMEDPSSSSSSSAAAVAAPSSQGSDGAPATAAQLRATRNPRLGIDSILAAIDTELQLLHDQWGDDDTLESLQRLRSHTLPPHNLPPAATPGAPQSQAPSAPPKPQYSFAPSSRPHPQAGPSSLPTNYSRPFASAAASPPSAFTPTVTKGFNPAPKARQADPFYPTAKASTYQPAQRKAQTMKETKSTPPPPPPQALKPKFESGTASRAVDATPTAPASSSSISPSSSGQNPPAETPKGSPNFFQGKWNQLETKLRGDHPSNMDANESKRHFLARVAFLKSKKGEHPPLLFFTLLF